MWMFANPECDRASYIEANLQIAARVDLLDGPELAARLPLYGAVNWIRSPTENGHSPVPAYSFHSQRQYQAAGEVIW
jgi:hypothetical protein